MHLRRLEPVLRRALDGPCRVRPGSRVLVAVSGGADSTALLVALRSLARERGLELHAAHLHHGLRGKDADADRDFVADLCARLGVPLTAARWDVRRRMRARGLSGEGGLRTLRREFLSRVAREAAADAIATAHTADDQLETLLLRLARGTGLRGLGAMRPRAGRWVKPLLEATRAEVEADLRRAGQEWREDRSNRDVRYARNRIRHEVVPALARAIAPASHVEPAPGTRQPVAARGAGLRRPGAGPAPRPAQDAVVVRAALARRAVHAAAEVRAAERAIERRLRPVFGRVVRREASGLAIDLAAARGLAPAFRTALLRRAWRAAAGRRPGLTSRHLGSLDLLLRRGRSGATIALPAGWIAARDRTSLRLQASRGHAGTILLGPVKSVAAPLRVPGSAVLEGCRLVGRWLPGGRAWKRISEMGPSEEYFAAEGIRGALELRSAGGDESFVPFGRRRRVRLGDFLKKQRVPLARRRRAAVLADASGILWVIGVRRSARAPVAPGTRRVLWVNAERHD